MDQNMVYYPFIRKSTKWTNKFVAYLFQISLYNAFTIYKAKNPQSNCKQLLTFIQGVVRVWTGARAGGEGASPSKPPLHDCFQRVPHVDPHCRLDANFAQHVLIVYPPTPNEKHPRKGCRVCAKKKKYRRTSYYCKRCNIPLHHGECYTLYHTKLNYAK